MKSNSTIQLKAIFLLIVFSLNTIIGFACSVGLDMGFNSRHHHHNGKSNNHHHQKSNQHHHVLGSHTTKSQPVGEIIKSGAPETGNCCNDDATQLSQSDKLLVNAINSSIEMPVALIALHFLYLSSHLSSLNPEITKIQDVRPYILNSRGIRVSIQSFQI
ncbi:MULTISPECIES: hypothetical protein [Niastella]|uniref:Cobalt transporter n=1 Tax=Niastella soli TaxID=2821487 RepID=A0ABS3YZR2_9BACT|nr:hypothetical protein [Niastella soli]MBO9202601.1 hypothetical protein [Niastella soli]